jgi:putative nucleotidyltransferase with HDIG domain
MRWIASELSFYKDLSSSPEDKRTMKFTKAKIAKQLIGFFGDDFRRIEHALSVLKHAERIAEDRLDVDHDVLIAAALLHDVGIKPSEKELGYNNGNTQETLSATTTLRPNMITLNLQS